MRVVLVSEGATAPLAAQVTPAWLAKVAAACTVQLNRDVAAYWGGSYSVRAGAGPTDIAQDEIVFALLDALPNDPTAIAYHDVGGNAVPYAVESLSACMTLDDVSKAISHELCEMAGDAACNVWVDDGQGTEFARELADPVEAWGYPIDGVMVSDFVLPAFFAVGAAGPYHYMAATGLMADGGAPFATFEGGYQIRRTAGVNISQVWGSIAPHRLAKKRHWTSRTYRRGGRP